MEAHHAISHLDDLELAILVCLIAGDHCIIRTPKHLLDRVQKEVEDSAANVFGLTAKTVQYGTSDDDQVLADALSNQVKPESNPSGNTLLVQVNVIIARHLNQAPHRVQLEALDLMRSKKLMSYNKALVLPNPFLFVSLLSDDAYGPPLFTPHLVRIQFCFLDANELTIR